MAPVASTPNGRRRLFGRRSWVPSTGVPSTGVPSTWVRSPSFSTEGPHAGDEALDDRLRKLEFRHPALAVRDRCRDLLVLDLVLPLGSAEVGGLEHRALGAVAMSCRAVARVALVTPGD